MAIESDLYSTLEYIFVSIIQFIIEDCDQRIECPVLCVCMCLCVCGVRCVSVQECWNNSEKSQRSWSIVADNISIAEKGKHLKKFKNKIISTEKLTLKCHYYVKKIILSNFYNSAHLHITNYIFRFQ